MWTVGCTNSQSLWDSLFFLGVARLAGPHPLSLVEIAHSLLCGGGMSPSCLLFSKEDTGRAARKETLCCAPGLPLSKWPPVSCPASLLLLTFRAVKLGAFPEHAHLLQQSVLAHTLDCGFNFNSNPVCCVSFRDILVLCQGGSHLLFQNHYGFKETCLYDFFQGFGAGRDKWSSTQSLILSQTACDTF